MISSASEQIKKQALERKEVEREKDLALGMQGVGGAKASRTIQPKKAFLLGITSDDSNEDD